MTFYHGSNTKNLTKLGTLSKAHDNKKSSVVYLTPNRAYALFYVRDLNINYVTCGVNEKGIIRYDERFENQIETLYKGKSGYLYCFNENQAFEKTSSNDIWVSKEPLKIENCEFIPDIYDEILKYEARGTINIIRYNLLSENEKNEIFEMIIWSLFKTGLTEIDSPKASFYKENFKEAWNFVVSNPQLKQSVLEEWELKMKNQNK